MTITKIKILKEMVDQVSMIIITFMINSVTLITNVTRAITIIALVEDNKTINIAKIVMVVIDTMIEAITITTEKKAEVVKVGTMLLTF